ncbi:hypothetical protein [Agrobacterium pusense]|uniref:hypothetical protein n=1 Tax=Agrobacterium pusense TaxID=648995 RepID=UPI0021CE3A37|nr:hypothetical protein [Agrobacterium pusense]UXT92883.1 hypothetical protein FY130_24000 [Agrobacterium pusense]
MRLINVTTKKELVAALAKRYARGKREENRVSSISSFRSGSRPLVEERQMHPAPDSKKPSSIHCALNKRDAQAPGFSGKSS